MKEDWQDRYRHLKLDLATSDPGDGLLVTEKHWNALQKAMKACVFDSMEEEIYFFKTVKPLFTSKLEVYHLQKAEVKNPFIRLQHFKEKHPDFCEYYLSGATENDHVWFVRYSGLTSSHDHLVAQLLALQELVRMAVFTESQG